MHDEQSNRQHSRFSQGYRCWRSREKKSWASGRFPPPQAEWRQPWRRSFRRFFRSIAGLDADDTPSSPLTIILRESQGVMDPTLRPGNLGSLTMLEGLGIVLGISCRGCCHIRPHTHQDDPLLPLAHTGLTGMGSLEIGRKTIPPQVYSQA